MIEKCVTLQLSTIPKFLGDGGGEVLENMNVSGQHHQQTELDSGRQLTQKPQWVRRQKHSLTCTRKAMLWPTS